MPEPRREGHSKEMTDRIRDKLQCLFLIRFFALSGYYRRMRKWIFWMAELKRFISGICRRHSDLSASGSIQRKRDLVCNADYRIHCCGLCRPWDDKIYKTAQCGKDGMSINRNRTVRMIWRLRKSAREKKNKYVPFFRKTKDFRFIKNSFRIG